MGSFVAGLDATVVNVALPSIRDDLGGGLAGQQWVSNAYLLTLGSLILVAGSLGDLYGERRVFSIGVGGFGLVSIICALAPTIEVLIAGRALQGVFGALLTPSALAVIISTFPPEERGARDRLLDGVVGDRDGDRAAGRRLARRHRVVALDLRHQRPVRAGRRWRSSRSPCRSRTGARATGARSTGSARCSPCSASPGPCSR